MRQMMVAVAMTLGASGCGVYLIAHDQQAAAKAASEFAQVAFLDRDFVKAHALLAPVAASQTPVAKLAEIINQMHPTGFPEQVTAAESESMPGQRGMMIYLNGTRDGKEYHDRFIMEGDRPRGYRVLTALRRNAPYPPSRRMPLR